MPRGVVRKLDKLHRVVPPREMLKSLGIEAGDPVDIYISGGRLIIDKLRLQCVMCGCNDESRLMEVEPHAGCAVLMCPSCVVGIKRWIPNEKEPPR